MGWTVNLTQYARSGSQRDATLAERLHGRLFEAIYRGPRLQRLLGGPRRRSPGARDPGDRMLVITSAGCNVLDYALAGPAAIHAVDANPRQNALLELKLAGIRRLDFDDFFRLFGEGRHPGFRELYGDALRADLSQFARASGIAQGRWFRQPRIVLLPWAFGPRSTSVPRLSRAEAEASRRPRALFEASSLDEQRAIYDARVAPRLWTDRCVDALEPAHDELLGVPHPQRKEIERQHADGVAGFVREALEYVARPLPSRRNYFWSVYLRGAYTASCCPEYLQAAELRGAEGGACRSDLRPYLDRHRVSATDARADLGVRAARPHGLDERLPARCTRARNGRRFSRARPTARG